MVAAAIVLGLGLLPARADKGKKPEIGYAVVAGTVFRASGLTLGGAEVTIKAAGDSKEARKFKKMSTVTNSRGEFAFRLPAAPRSYTVGVKAAGYQPQEKAVSVSGEDRMDVFILMEAASK